MKKQGKLTVGLIQRGVALVFITFFAITAEAKDENRNPVPGNPSDGRHAPDEILVSYAQGTDEKEIEQFERNEKASLKAKGLNGKVRLLKLTPGLTLEKALEKFRRHPKVGYAEPNFIAEVNFAPNDELFPLQWNMQNIDAESAWNVTAGSGVTVAVLDSGVAYENYTAGTKTFCQAPDLAQTCFVPGWDFVENDSHANDDNRHGTHVAGTVAGSTNNFIGVAGLAHDACIMPVKVLSQYGSGYYFDIAQGIFYAADNGAKVINMSLSGSAPSATLADALQYAYERGVTIVAAAGNSASSNPAYPAAYDDWVISVGATRYDNTLSYYSNFGSHTDLVAPGGDTKVDQNGDSYVDGVLQNTFSSYQDVCDLGYYFFQGTSMAAPHVAALAAMVIATGNAVTPDDVRCVLEASATDLGDAGRDDLFGWGKIDAKEALAWTCDEQPPVNLNPTADFGFSCNSLACSFTDTSTDNDGTIAQWSWNFGDGESSSDQNPSHSFAAGGTYAVSLTVTDDVGGTGSTSKNVKVSSGTSEPIEVFYDSFENGQWNGLWSEDSQNDWFTSTQRASQGNSSAEVDGAAVDAALISAPIDLQGLTRATISFKWYIEYRLDTGEYLAFDVSTDGGLSWTEKAKLRGNVDPEDSWESVSIVLDGISSLRVRFRGKMTGQYEDANLDEVRVMAEAGGEPLPQPVTAFSDSFESGSFAGRWTQDSQNDWFVSTLRTTSGTYSAEFDGRATDALLISNPIDLQGKTKASITFQWYLKRAFDTGEYMAFDVSTNGGSSWTQKAILQGNVDVENAWHAEKVDLDGITSLKIRFRGMVSGSRENASVDDVLVRVE